MKREGRTYAAGTAAGSALLLAAPLSFWGGVDPATGEIIDHSHPDLGRNVSGRILVMPAARGSSSASSVLAEAIRAGTGPVGIIVARADPIMVIGCLVAQKLYGLFVPMMVAPIDGIKDGDVVRIECGADGAAHFRVTA